MFSDHDNQSNAAAAAPEPETESAPNNAHPETISTVESPTEQTAPPAATEHAETASGGQVTPAGSTPEHTGAPTDVAAAHAAAEATREEPAAAAEATPPDEEAAGSEDI